MPRFNRTAHRISLTAMFASMSLLFLYLSSILPAGRIAAYFLSSVFVMGLVLEEEIGLAFLMFAAVSLLSLLMIPPATLRTVPYVLFFGHYGIGKYYIQRRFRDKIVSYAFRLLYYNAALALMYLLAYSLVEQEVLSSGLPIWALILIAEAAFVLYEYLFTRLTSYYYVNIRRFIMKN